MIPTDLAPDVGRIEPVIVPVGDAAAQVPGD
jgi:hypothetical protein